MTEAALRTMKEITSTYVEDGYPNYHVWWFRLRDDDSASSELMALGLIESIGSGYIGVLTGGVLGSHYSDIFAFIVLIVVLTLRPSGLLGERVADRA